MSDGCSDKTHLGIYQNGLFGWGAALYQFASFVLVGTMLFLAFNIFKPTVLVVRSRIAAVLLLLASLTFGLVFVDSLKTEKDEAALAAEKAKRYGTWDDVAARPQAYLELADRYHRDGAALSISGKLTNSSGYAIKDVKLKCRVISETSAVLWKGEKIVFKSVPANGSVKFGPLALTYLDEQAGGVGCRIADAKAAPGG